MSRSRITFVVLFTALVSSALLLVSPAQAALTARTVSITASPIAALTSTNVTFSGKLSKSPKGTNVKVQRKVGTKWVTVKTVKTKGPGGAYAATVVRPAKAGYYVYRAFAPRFEGLKAALSKPVTIAALRKTTFVRPDDVNEFVLQSTGKGDPGTAIGRLGAVHRRSQGSRPAQDQRRVDDAGQQHRDRNGIFVIGYPDSQSGEYRIVVSRKGLNASAVSKSRSYIFTSA